MIRAVEHVREREGEYYVANTRVPVGVVVAAWKRGEAPDRIGEQFPSLSLADVYGVITYYLDHQDDLDAHFDRLEREYEDARRASRAERPEFYAELQRRIETRRGEHSSTDDAVE